VNFWRVPSLSFDAAIYQPNLHGRHDIVSFARDRVAAELTAVGAPVFMEANRWDNAVKLYDRYSRDT
jgi:hypothetical protein